MHIHINLGAIISGICSLFRRKKKDQVEHTMVEGNQTITNTFNDGQEQTMEQPTGQTTAEKVVLTTADTLDLFEQIGALEDLNIQDEVLKQKLCLEMADILNENEQNEQSAQDAFIRVFRQNGINVSLNMASMFASAYMDCYVYCEE